VERNHCSEVLSLVNKSSRLYLETTRVVEEDGDVTKEDRSVCGKKRRKEQEILENEGSVEIYEKKKMCDNICNDNGVV
jgi:hypothetical protein